ncbi:sigma-70 family RNA polymerase sigma factor [Streptomyces sp. NBC_00536]|uniref:sigma-70 family RNA polymerase sigma factor n=1 Tax=Streptomyces sp. NBC_00536 TaxID=2975769 RepID=UPI002E8070B6|nr:sigma-70 family RNA polymerase sigma factor [Streptomyces sp. NBC_00536]WUC77999.1 sigma-70 family RNA polymerase sigma factor [Streptomyces sp. NBC_00536]
MTTTTLARPRPYPRTEDGALERLQREHGRALYGFLLALTHGDRQRAEDLVQETLFRVWTHPEALANDAHPSPRPWLFTVGRRLAIDARRARLVRPTEVAADALEQLPYADDTAERAVAALDLRLALRSLSREHRAVLVQIYFRGASVTETAEALGIPAGTVKSRTHYALRALRSALPGYGPGRVQSSAALRPAA